MPQRQKVPKPPDRLTFGGEPTGVLHTGEIISRLERNRRTQGHCRPQHRLESGAISELQNVKSDLPVCCRAPGAPPAEKLQILLQPRHELQEVSRAQRALGKKILPVPVPVVREPQRLLRPPAAEIQELTDRPPAAQLLHYEDIQPAPKERRDRASHQPQGLIFPYFKSDRQSSRRLNPVEYPAFTRLLPN